MRPIHATTAEAAEPPGSALAASGPRPVPAILLPRPRAAAALGPARHSAAPGPHSARPASPRCPAGTPRPRSPPARLRGHAARCGRGPRDGRRAATRTAPVGVGLRRAGRARWTWDARWRIGEGSCSGPGAREKRLAPRPRPATCGGAHGATFACAAPATGPAAGRRPGLVSASARPCAPCDGPRAAAASPAAAVTRERRPAGKGMHGAAWTAASPVGGVPHRRVLAPPVMVLGPRPLHPRRGRHQSWPAASAVPSSPTP